MFTPRSIFSTNFDQYLKCMYVCMNVLYIDQPERGEHRRASPAHGDRARDGGDLLRRARKGRRESGDYGGVRQEESQQSHAYLGPAQVHPVIYTKNKLITD